MVIAKQPAKPTREGYGWTVSRSAPTERGFVYLAGIKDLCGKKVVGFSLSAHMDTNLIPTALTRAIQTQRPPIGLILHSDRGSQYCSAAYQEKIKNYGMICSMSKKGDCYDNALMERFWGLLKKERIHHRRYTTHQEAIRDVSEYIEIFYNRQRRQAALGYLSPAASIKKLETEKLAAKAA